MNRSFRRHGDRVRMQLQEVEVGLLRSMRDGLYAALASGDPQDPVVERLFPQAVLGDAESDAELRRLLHDDLLAERLAALDDLVALLERGVAHRGGLRVDLDLEEASLVLGVLNDLRLSIGARIGIEEVDRDTITEEDPTWYRLAVMDHFAWLQEQLLAVLDPESVRVHDELGPEDLA